MRQFCQAFVQVLGPVIAQQQMTHTDQTLFKCHDFFVWSSCNTRGHSMKLCYPDSRVTARQFFSPVRVVQLWNKLSEKVVSASSVSASTSRLNSM